MSGQLPLLPSVESLKIIVPGEPVPKARHRARIVQPRGRPPFVHMYQDAETEKYESLVAKMSGMVMAGRGLLLGALDVRATAYVEIPASWPQKKRVQAGDGEILPVSRPDADNYLKCVLDAMNGVVYKDDSQVVNMSVQKRYSFTPRMEIEIFSA